MFQCANSASYPMKADIYTAYQLQDNLTGVVKKTWDFTETVVCSAKAGQSRTSMGEGSFLKPAGVNEYADYVKLRSPKAIPLGKRVVNIRNSDQTVWTEKDDRTGLDVPTHFEVRGNGPILGLAGEVMCYEMILSRVDVQ